MPTLAEVRKLARDFESTYTPRSLAERLGIFSSKLGINRVRFLRLLGLSSSDAKEYKNTDKMDEVVNLVGEERARLVEGLLVRLLSLYSYDWCALSNTCITTPPPQLRAIEGVADGPAQQQATEFS